MSDVIVSHQLNSFGYVIDLDRLYWAMDEQAVEEDGQRVFNGGLDEVRGVKVRALKRLLHDLFDVPVTDNYHYTNDRIRTAARERLAELGWATNEPPATPRYVLHRTPESGPSASTFLLTWNPKRGFAWDERDDIILATSAGSPVANRWTCGSRKSGFAFGDKVYLMKLGDEPRGIAASGTVTNPLVRQEPHWDGTPGKFANCIDVQWERAVDDSELLSVAALKVALPSGTWEPQGGGVFISPENARELADLWSASAMGNLDSTQPDRRQAREAGYLADSAVRGAIERHAELVAAAHYEAAGYSVEFVGLYRSYDLHLLNAATGEERHVEVKGSSGQGMEVELTKGEVEHASKHQPTDLFVVSDIAWSKRGDSVVVSGGVARLYADWKPTKSALTAVRFRYQTPAKFIPVRTE